LATLDVIEEEKLIDQAQRKGELIRKRLEEMKEKYDVIGDVRGIGMMQAIEFVVDRKTKEPAKHLRDDISTLCIKRGIVVIGCGRSGLRLIPPLMISDEHLNIGLDIIETCIRDGAKTCK
jgi:4-aminobutyrate aminotransferase